MLLSWSWAHRIIVVCVLLGLALPVLNGCGESYRITSDAAPAPQPPHQRWFSGTASPERLLTPTMGIFQRISIRGNQTWMQGEYRSGDAVVQITAIPLDNEDGAMRALGDWTATQQNLNRQVHVVAGDQPRAAWSAELDGKKPEVCWVHGVYLVRATLLTPHGAETLRLLLANWR